MIFAVEICCFMLIPEDSEVFGRAERLFDGISQHSSVLPSQ
jgi:hypothetical protein